MKSKEEIEGLGNLYLINETRKWVEDDIPEVYTQDDIIKAVAWGYDEGVYDATKWHYPSKGELPPKWGFYLVTLEYSDKRFVTLASWHELEHKWHGFNGEWYNPIAWMPLPDPPKEEA